VLPYPCVPTVTSEALTMEAQADIFVDVLGISTPPPFMPGTTPIGNVAMVDGA